jgi:hypothetical protein
LRHRFGSLELAAIQRSASLFAFLLLYALDEKQ